MNGGQVLVTIVVALAIISIFGPFLFGALKESGRIKMPGRKTFRQFPTFPVQGGEEDELF